MNADGSISADMRRKLNQVNHLVELFRPVLTEIGSRRGAIRVLDANCGNSYLGFLLHHYAAVKLGIALELVGARRASSRAASAPPRSGSPE
jgi:hypothetical protein